MTINDEKEAEINPRCFFDLEIGGVSAGRVVFELFADQCPKTADNFRQLCTGEGGVGKTTGKPLHFKGTVFHRVIKDFMIQGGDFSNFNGTGGESIYGGTFEDENLLAKHDEPFLLSMANRGTNTNGSQFFILTQPAPHLNGIHVVFGKVISGQPIIKQVEGLPVDRKSRPLSDVRVANCGELVLLKKKKEKKPKKEKKEKELKKSDEEEDEIEKSAGELSESGSDDKKKKRKKKASESSVAEGSENEEVQHPLVSLRNIDPDGIPKDPSNHFLSRNKIKSEEEGEKKDDKEKDKDKKKSRRSRSKSKSRSRSPRSRDRERKDREKDRGRRPDDHSRFGTRCTDNEGRKIKGRGRICFPRFTSRSRSKTPPHWKAETRKTISMKEFEEREKKKRDRDEELHRRQEERKKRHEETVRPEPEKERERPREPFSSMRHRLERRTSEKEKERPRDSFRSRFQNADEKSPSREPEPKSKTPDLEQSSKIVEELTSKLQAAGDGVVYYQHLYKGSTSTTSNAQPNLDLNAALAAAAQAKINIGIGAVEFDAQKGKRPLVPDADEEEADEDEDEGPPGEEDESVLAELRLRRELLKKRLKDWEEDSDDGGTKEQSNRDKTLQSAMQAELRALNEREGLSESIAVSNTVSDSIIPPIEKKHSKSRSKSASKSRSRSKSKSRSRDRRDKRKERERDRKSRKSSRNRSSSRNRTRGDGSRSRRNSSRDRNQRDRRDRGGRRRDSSRGRRDRSRSRSRGHRRR